MEFCQARRHQFVAGRPQVIVQRHVLDGQQWFQVFDRAWADQRRSDAGLLLGPQDG